MPSPQSDPLDDEFFEELPPPPYHNETQMNRAICYVEICSILSPLRHSTLCAFVDQALAQFELESAGGVMPAVAVKP